MRSPDLEPDRVELSSKFVGSAPRPVATGLSSRTSWLVLALISLLYVGVSFSPVICNGNEGLYAGAVRDMHARHDWLVPTSNGSPQMQDPPFVYWAMLLSTTVLGENEFALRLPNALATAGWIVATYLIMRCIGGERFGLVSAVALASMPGVWILTHFVQPEPFLACFLSLSLWCLIEARNESRPAHAWYLLFWIFLALGALSDGLRGMLWPLGLMMLLATFFPSWRPWLRPLLTFRGLALFVVITVPWYAYMTAKVPGFLEVHFASEQVGAMLGTVWLADVKQLSILQFYTQHLLFWMPWALLLPAAIWASRRVAPSSPESRIAQARQRLGLGSFGEGLQTPEPTAWTDAQVDSLRLLACWLILVLTSAAFFMRQDSSSMSCWGVITAFLVYPWTLRQTGGLRVPRAFLAGPALVVMLVGLGALGFCLFLAKGTAAYNGLAFLMGPIETFNSALDQSSPALRTELLPFIVIFGAVLLAGGLVSAWLAWKRRYLPALIFLAATMVGPIIFAARGFTLASPYDSLAEIGNSLNRFHVTHPAALVACEGAPITASSLLYYLYAPVHWVNAPSGNPDVQSRLGPNQDLYWDESVLDTAWGKGVVYLIIEDGRRAYWERHLASAHVLLHIGRRYVLVNR